MSEPLDLDAIYVEYDNIHFLSGASVTAAWTKIARHVPALLAEIERLRTELDDERAAHAKTCSNFEEWCETSAAEVESVRKDLHTLLAKVDLLRDLAVKAKAWRDWDWLHTTEEDMAKPLPSHALLAAIDRLYPPDGEP